MNTWIFTGLAAICLLVPRYGMGAEPAPGGSQAVVVAADSPIAAAVKSKLTIDPLAGVTELQVVTDRDGVVWLSGAVRTPEAADRAVEIARNTAGVVRVQSQLVVDPNASRSAL
jgi:osmotically-inducible protein OsmY